MKKLWILMGVVIIALTAGVIVMNNEGSSSIYEPDYFSKLGLSYHKHQYSYKYTTMINDLGQPIKIEEDGKYVYYFYQGMFFRYNKYFGIMHDSATNVTVTSDKYKFGKDKIGVGSTRDEVEKAYRKAKFKIVKNDSSGFRDGSLNSDQWVKFYFDKDNKVRAIELGLEI